MKENKLQKNKEKGFTHTPNLVSGFTIVEAIIAIFILSISVSSMLGLTISSYSSAKYASNEITANYLLQEAIDTVRNSRDTMVFQQNIPWGTFLDVYGKTGSSACFSSNGCTIATESFNPASPGSSISLCNITSGYPNSSSLPCPALKFNPNDSVDNSANYFYSVNGSGSASRFKRQVKMANTANPNEVEVTATVEYPYGTTFKTKILKMDLLNWH